MHQYSEGYCNCEGFVSMLEISQLMARFGVNIVYARNGRVNSDGLV